MTVQTRSLNAMRGLLIAICYCTLVTSDKGSIRLPGSHENIGLGTIELIQKYGYPAENYNVETDDGYIINLVRIPHNATNSSQSGPAVLIQHGIQGSSDDFLILGPQSGLAFLLSDQGYDVWLGNSRGNKYSLGHKNLSTDSSEFWDFSFHELGMYDLPACINKVLNVSGKISLGYIGHSQGTTSAYVLLSQKPEYNNKIRVLISMAPIAFMQHTACQPCHIAASNPAILQFIGMLGLKNMRPDPTLLNLFAQIFCNGNAMFNVCKEILMSMFGNDPAQLDSTNVPLIFSVMPAGASFKQFLHYMQLVHSGKFSFYDYGVVNNLLRYGTTNPPDYQLSNITTSVALYYALNDPLSSIVDVGRLNKSLNNVVEYRQIDYPTFNHIDYIWAIDVKQYVYNHIFDTLKKYYP